MKLMKTSNGSGFIFQLVAGPVGPLKIKAQVDVITFKVILSARKAIQTSAVALLAIQSNRCHQIK